jgi:hypothetical protein
VHNWRPFLHPQPEDAPCFVFSHFGMQFSAPSTLKIQAFITGTCYLLNVLWIFVCGMWTTRALSDARKSLCWRLVTALLLRSFCTLVAKSGDKFSRKQRKILDAWLETTDDWLKDKGLDTGGKCMFGGEAWWQVWCKIVLDSGVELFSSSSMLQIWQRLIGFTEEGNC